MPENPYPFNEEANIQGPMGEEGEVMTVDLSKECKAETVMSWSCNPNDLCERHKCSRGHCKC